MFQKRGKLIKTMLFSLIFSLGFFITGTVYASARKVNPYPETQLQLNLGYEDSELTARTTGGESMDYTYEYWVRAKISTDKAAGETAYLWQKLPGTAIFAEIDEELLDEDLLSFSDEDGNYSIAVRVYKQDVLVTQIHKLFSLEEAGHPSIFSLEIDGNAIGKEITAVTEGNSTLKLITGAQAEYFIKINDTELTLVNNACTVNFSNFPTGINNITVGVKGIKSTEKNYSIYVLNEFIPESTPVIKAFSGKQETDGSTTFTMQIAMADSVTQITEGMLDTFNYLVESQVKEVTFDSKKVNPDGTADISFTATYDKEGIYYVTAKVFDQSGAQCDNAAIYYDEFNHTASVGITSSLGEGVYSIEQKNTPIVFSAVNPLINGELPQNITYAFFRESASGWEQLTKYTDEDTFTWTPSRYGTYNFQIRISEDGNPVYYARSNIEITVGQVALDSDDFEIVISELQGGKRVDALYAGKAYILSVQTKDGSSMPTGLLYQFRLFTELKQHIYLNSFGTDNSFIFVPEKTETYFLYANIIDYNNSGYKDIMSEITVSSQALKVHDGSKLGDSFEYALPTYLSVNNPAQVTLSHSNQGATEGNYSIAFSVTQWEAYGRVIFDKQAVENYAVYDYIEFDITNPTARNIEAYVENQTNGALKAFTISAGKTTVISLSKAQLNTLISANKGIHLVNNTAGNAFNYTYYIDNLRGRFDAVEAAVLEDCDLSPIADRVNTAFATTLKDLTVVHQDGEEAAVGGNILNAVKDGKYTAYYTFTAPGYIDFTLTADIEVSAKLIAPHESYENGVPPYVTVNSGVSVATVKTDGATDGEYSLEMSVIGSQQWYPSIVLLTPSEMQKYLIYDYIEIDIYHPTGVGGYFSDKDNHIALFRPTFSDGKATVRFTKAQLEDLLSGNWGIKLHFNNDNPAIDFKVYFDNIKGGFTSRAQQVEYTVGEAAVGVPSGIQLSKIKVEKGGEVIHQSATELSYTFNANGDYKVSLTYSGQGYYDFTAVINYTILDVAFVSGTVSDNIGADKIILSTGEYKDISITNGGIKATVSGGYPAFSLNTAKLLELIGSGSGIKLHFITYALEKHEFYVETSSGTYTRFYPEGNTTFTIDLTLAEVQAISQREANTIIHGCSYIYGKGGDEFFTLIFEGLEVTSN